MESSRIGTWLSIGANLGVIGGLVLVALQLNQNSELLRLQMLEQESRRATDHELAYVGEAGPEVWAKVIEDPANLTFREQRVAESLIWSSFESWRSLHKLHDAGLIGPEWKDRVREEVPYVLGHPYGRAWWKNIKEQTAPGEIADDLRDEVESVLAEYEQNYHWDYHKGVMKHLDVELSE